MDENLNMVDAHTTKTLKKKMVKTMTHGNVLIVHNKSCLPYFEFEVGQKLFLYKHYLVMFGKFIGDTHCKMVFIHEIPSSCILYIFTENNVNFPSPRNVQKLKKYSIDDVVAAIQETVTNKTPRRVHGIHHIPHSADGGTRQVTGLYEKFFLDLHSIPINSGSETVKFSDIMRWRSGDTPCKAEEVHDFIQWVFPNANRSSVNAIEPIKEDEAKAIRENPETLKKFIDGYEWFLNFLGIRLDRTTGIPRTNDDWSIRKAIIDNPINHNFQRLTRVLYALREFGLCNYMGYLYAFLLIYYEHSTAQCKQYWWHSFDNDKLEKNIYNHYIQFQYNLDVEDLSSMERYTMWLSYIESKEVPPEDILEREPRPGPTNPSRGIVERESRPGPSTYKFKVDDLCFFVPDGGVRITVRITKVNTFNVPGIPDSYEVEDIRTGARMNADHENELLLCDSLVKRADNLNFQPNLAIFTAGYNSTNWDITAMNAVMSGDRNILRGFYRNEYFAEQWNDIRNMTPDASYISNIHIQLLQNLWCNMYGGLTVGSDLQERNQHLERRLVGRETYLVLLGSIYFHPDGTFNNIDALWGNSDAIRNINPDHIDNILIPKNISNTHWILVHISLKNRQIIIYDSLNNINNTHVDAVQSFIRSFYNRKLEDDLDEWESVIGTPGINNDTIRRWYNYTLATNIWPVSRPKVDQQRDGFACGIYVCMIMAYILSGKTAQIDHDIVFNNIAKFRRLLARLMCEIDCLPRE